ncbi:MAG: MBL fold metallo-hydrolase [Deltaproteobacteria bacterium]|nr:MBL fold metallo-hydrolase [Deltaproteobacteria bacterium]
MLVRFWGTRGSLPASLTEQAIREKISFALRTALKRGLSPEAEIDAFMDGELPFWARGTYGTSTPCVEIQEGEDILLCDAGSGLRGFGHHTMRTCGPPVSRTFHIFLSHLHWDHIQGFPFFVPAYIKGCEIVLYGCHQEMEEAFSLQQSPPFFPVRLKELAAHIRFVTLTPGESYEVRGFTVTAIEQRHPGRSYGYRFERNGRTIVYSTDSEHSYESDEEARPFLDFIRGADLLIFDAQYTFIDAITVKQDWGHSNNLLGVELAQKARVKHLCLYHMEPVSPDQDLKKFLADTKRLASLLNEGIAFHVSMAYDGMVIEFT